MKNIILVVLLTTIACKAQSPIIGIHDKDTEIVSGSYLKDINNELDNFVGTWLYTNGNTSLTVVFQKQIQVYNDNWYEDLLVGEYRYVENGVEKVNTLSNFDNPDDLESPYEHNLIGNYMIFKSEFPGCTNCDISEKRVKIYFEDPDPNLSHLDGMAMGLRYINGLPPQMQIDYAKKGTSVIPEGASQEPNLPFGRYILTKQ